MPATGRPSMLKRPHPRELKNLAQYPDLPHELSSTQVAVRFCLRIIILVIFASFAGIGFGKSLAALLWMSVILSAVIGAIKREAPLDTVLNHWDETVAYLALCYLVGGLNQAVPI
jgi:hypothetical protein